MLGGGGEENFYRRFYLTLIMDVNYLPRRRTSSPRNFSVCDVQEVYNL